jgi:TM2 domain-containing membrane protein YozV
VPQKDPGIAAILALVAGIFGLMGMGHIYLGRITRGLIILVSGIALWSLSFFFLLAGVFGPTGFLWILSLVCLIAVIGLLAWQVYDAHALAKQYNEVVRRTGRTPW